VGTLLDAGVWLRRSTPALVASLDVVGESRKQRSARKTDA